MLVPYTAEELLTALILEAEPTMPRTSVSKAKVDQVQAEGIAKCLRWSVDDDKNIFLWLTPNELSIPSDPQPNRLRRTVLRLLYSVYFKAPDASVDQQTLAEMAVTDRTTLTPQVKLLEEEGWIKCSYFQGGDYLVKITAAGIRLVENAAEFQRMFPFDGESED